MISFLVHFSSNQTEQYIHLSFIRLFIFFPKKGILDLTEQRVPFITNQKKKKREKEINSPTFEDCTKNSQYEDYKNTGLIGFDRKMKKGLNGGNGVFTPRQMRGLISSKHVESGLLFFQL
ncbi:hypothetical protein V6Z11_A05G339800 [Gossypium hirsutum]